MQVCSPSFVRSAGWLLFFSGALPLMRARSAVFGELDPMQDVSSSIMLGQLARFGTNAFDLMLDEDMLDRMPVSNLRLPWYHAVCKQLTTPTSCALLACEQERRNPFAAAGFQQPLTAEDHALAADGALEAHDQGVNVSPAYPVSTSPAYPSGDMDDASPYTPSSPLFLPRSPDYSPDGYVAPYFQQGSAAVSPGYSPDGTADSPSSVFSPPSPEYNGADADMWGEDSLDYVPSSPLFQPKR